MTTLTTLHDKLNSLRIQGNPGPHSSGFNSALSTAESVFEQHHQDIPASVRILQHQLTYGANDPFDRGFKEGIQAAIDALNSLKSQMIYDKSGSDWRLKEAVIYDKKPALIGLTGLAGSGKDTVAALLSMLGYERMAFADPLREEAKESIAHLHRMANGQVTDRPADIRLKLAYGIDLLSLIASGAIKPDDVYLKPTPPAIRELLQRHGTEFRRAQDENYWVRRVFDAPTMTGLLVISDVRFPNEADAIRARGGVIWCVIRKTLTPAGWSDHVSESGQSEITPDATIDNNGSLIDLAKKVKALLPCGV